MDSNIRMSVNRQNGSFVAPFGAAVPHLRSLYGRCSPVDTIDRLFERSVLYELTDLLRHWLRELQAVRAAWQVPVDTMALMLSWATFGAAIQWSKGNENISVDEMTDRVLTVLTDGAKLEFMHEEWNRPL